MDIKETPEQVIARVASGFREHFTMLALQGVGQSNTYANSTRRFELAQVAVQIYSAIMPEDITARAQDKAYELRSFLEQCGFSDIFAHDFISDDDPDGIY